MHSTTCAVTCAAGTNCWAPHPAVAPPVAHDTLPARAGAAAVHVVALGPAAQVLAVHRGALVGETHIRLRRCATEVTQSPPNKMPLSEEHQRLQFVLQVQCAPQRRPPPGDWHPGGCPASAPSGAPHRRTRTSSGGAAVVPCAALAAQGCGAPLSKTETSTSQQTWLQDKMQCVVCNRHIGRAQTSAVAHVPAGVERTAQWQVVADLLYMWLQVLRQRSGRSVSALAKARPQHTGPRKAHLLQHLHDHATAMPVASCLVGQQSPAVLGRHQQQHACEAQQGPEQHGGWHGP